MSHEQATTKLIIPIFVYGTLKPGEKNYRYYCEGKTLTEIPAYTWGQLYHLPALGYPGMTKGNSKVQGWLLIFEDEQILASLDLLESYQEERSPFLNEYNRQQVPIYSLAGDFLRQAWCYVMSFTKVQQQQGILVSDSQWHSKF
ncbi:MAG TPA: gamma-glutamylcyclotransferase [Xenococcaceae cyanobacterium]